MAGRAAFPEMLLITGKCMEISDILVSLSKTELVAFMGNSHGSLKNPILAISTHCWILISSCLQICFAWLTATKCVLTEFPWTRVSSLFS